MIKEKSELREILKYEENIYKPGIKKYMPFLFDEFQILHRIVYLLRMTEFYTNTSAWPQYIYKYRLRRLENLYGVHIPLNVCAKGLSIAHVGSIVINSECRIGENCRLHVGVNIGANGGESPVIGDNVYIGPGAKIFGNIQIADECKIGANAVVNQSCRIKGATLVGVPAIIKESKRIGEL